ncbi:MAG: PadR family transcriptional regulator [Xanthobacteraceae bacterium]
MTTKSRLSNPLALAVLVLLLERPMHPYEMASTLRERHAEGAIKLRYGSLYTVIELLQREGYVVPAQTTREGRRPERTVYALTPTGEVEMRDWLADLLSNPVKEYPRFEAALALLPALRPERVTELLEARLTHLEREIERVQANLASLSERIPRLFVIEVEYYVAILEAERRFTSALTSEIKNQTLDGLAFWNDFHARRPAAAPEAVQNAAAGAVEQSASATQTAAVAPMLRRRRTRGRTVPSDPKQTGKYTP